RAALSAGFRRLAGYIFGANHVARQIAMTAPVGQFPVVQSPVVQSPAGRTIAMTAPVAHAPNPDGSWTVRFFMPAAETPETLPEPNDPAVRLVMVPASTCAVLRFSGRPTEAAIASARRLLLATLAGSLWRPAGEPLIWYYDPPWTLPFLRRNEVVMPVVPATLAPTALAPAAPAASGAAPDVTAAPR
ncbi:MAG: heme-binding protein, partial [Rhodospirillales bacterium]|nr:heme-binding protein [Rhodospirillales bacterium]